MAPTRPAAPMLATVNHAPSAPSFSLTVMLPNQPPTAETQRAIAVLPTNSRAVSTGRSRMEISAAAMHRAASREKATA